MTTDFQTLLTIVTMIGFIVTMIIMKINLRKQRREVFGDEPRRRRRASGEDSSSYWDGDDGDDD